MGGRSRIVGYISEYIEKFTMFPSFAVSWGKTFLCSSLQISEAWLNKHGCSYHHGNNNCLRILSGCCGDSYGEESTQQSHDFL